MNIVSTSWNDYFEIIFKLEDEKKQTEQDTQRVNAMINALQKRNIPIERKRRKGRILKELRRKMYGWSESTRYTRTAIRNAIIEIRWQDFEKEIKEINITCPICLSKFFKGNNLCR